MNPTVSTQWLSQNLNDPNLILLDASPESTIDGRKSEFHSMTIPGARLIDLEKDFSDTSSSLPHVLPSPEQFETESRKLGINTNSKIIVFDNLGIYTSPRFWWMFKTMGHEDVYVLDGGIPEWAARGNELGAKIEGNYPPGNFKARFQKDYLVSYEDVLRNATDPSFTIVDARSEGRFKGTSPEPRPHLKSGSIPNSVNIPFGEVLENGKFKSGAELKQIFESTCGGTQNLVYSCGSGLTACIILTAGEIAGRGSKKVYDGSWTEWAELQNLKVE
ncbi:MAG: sulfurtransferase [Bacteroidota bacterium]